MKIFRIFASVIVISAAISVGLYYYSNANSKRVATVGIIVPLEHVALNDIVDGFTSELKAALGENIAIKVQNAQGDMQIQRTMISHFLDEKVDLLVPVTTSTTQMALKLANKEQPIVFLAANIPPDSNAAKTKPNMAGVIDEIPLVSQLDFMQKIVPDLSKVTMVFSTDPKVFDEAETYCALAKDKGIDVQRLMVHALSDLYTISQSIDKDSQAIFILKDNLVASGIEALVQQAEKRGLPLITSDEGTVSKGATVALGVRERSIGTQGAKLAARMFQGEGVHKLPIEYMKNISIFVNQQALKKQSLALTSIEDAARALSLDIIFLERA